MTSARSFSRDNLMSYWLVLSMYNRSSSFCVTMCGFLRLIPSAMMKRRRISLGLKGSESAVLNEWVESVCDGALVLKDLTVVLS
jgi:hypothetical protein